MTGKFNNRHVKIDGHTFDSKAEARRYSELKMLQRAGKINELTVHPSFKAEINGEKICRIELDFQYFDTDKGIWIQEDVKGFDPPISRLKRKLLKALYPELNLFILTAR